MAGIVDNTLLSARPSPQEKMQIAVDRADQGCRDRRIENTLAHKVGGGVRLKRALTFEVTLKPNKNNVTLAP